MSEAGASSCGYIHLGDGDMTKDAKASLAGVGQAVAVFRRYLAEDVRGQVYLTPLYRVRAALGEAAHWPAPYRDVFQNVAGEPLDPEAGVYLHFDTRDSLLYVGKAVSIGSRLNAYFQFGEARTCRIAERFQESCGVRVVPLNAEIAFLAPALEWFLIGRLDPPLNKQGRSGMLTKP